MELSWALLRGVLILVYRHGGKLSHRGDMMVVSEIVRGPRSLPEPKLLGNTLHACGGRYYARVVVAVHQGLIYSFPSV